MQATVNWNHHFWGNYCATVYACFSDEHTAKVFSERVLKEGSNVRPYEFAGDHGYVAIITVKNDKEDELRARLESLRIPDDICPRCKQRHEVADTAHSIDSAVPIVVDFGTVEHPGQQTLFP